MGVFSFQLDELWFNLNANLLCDALGITPKDSAHPFVPPLDGDLIIDFVNNLGYLEELHFVSKMHVNNLYQPWRTILSMINQCLTCKTSGGDKSRHPVLQMLWDVVTRTNVPTKKLKPPVIPYCRFTKLNIYYLGGRHYIHRRPQPPIHIMADDYPINNLKFVSKGEVDKVFRMPIPKDLITDAIRNLDYYKKYLEMAAHNPRQLTTMTGEEVGKKKEAPKAGKSKQHAPAKQPKTAKKKTSKPIHSKKIYKGKRSDHLVDEKDEEGQPASDSQVEDDEYNLQRVITQKLPDVEGKGKGIVSDEQAAQSLPDLQKPKKQSIKDQYIFQRRTPVTQDASTGPSVQPQDDTSMNVVHDTFETGTKILNIEEEQGKEVSNKVALKERTIKLDKGQAGSDPGWINPGQSHVAQAGPNPEPMHEDFIAIIYPKVHENLKLTTEEQVHIENPPSSSGTLSSMKNLKEDFTFATTATTITTLPLPPPPPQQSTTVPELATHFFALEKICDNFQKRNKLQDKTTQAISSRVYTFENHDLYSKIDKYVNEVVKEAVHNALQAPIRERFKELSEFEMKEILRDRMFESGSYRSHPEHTTLYEAREASMDRKNREDFNEEMAKSRKKRFQNSSAWKTSDTIEALSSSSKQKYASPSEQPVDDVPIPDDVHLSDLEDTGAAYFLTIKTRPDWLKPLPEEKAPETPEPDWVIPPNNLPETKNNWADAL
ncbi:hypothetical protein Tco_1118137 [Tanacetum coccineum]